MMKKNLIIPDYVGKLVEWTKLQNAVPSDIIHKFIIINEVIPIENINLPKSKLDLERLSVYFQRACHRYDFEHACFCKYKTETTYIYTIEAFDPATLGGYGVRLESPWGPMFVFNIKPEIKEKNSNEKLIFNLTNHDIRHFEIESYYTSKEFEKMKSYVNAFYEKEQFYEKSKQKFKKKLH